MGFGLWLLVSQDVAAFRREDFFAGLVGSASQAAASGAGVSVRALLRSAGSTSARGSTAGNNHRLGRGGCDTTTCCDIVEEAPRSFLGFSTEETARFGMKRR